MNRLISVAYNNSTPVVTYGYDPAVTNGIGQLGTVSNSNAIVSYSAFDSLGNILASSDGLVGLGQTYSFVYAYNLASQLTRKPIPLAGPSRRLTTPRGASRRYSSYRAARC